MEPHNSHPSRRRSRSPPPFNHSTKSRRRSRSPEHHKRRHHRHYDSPSSRNPTPQVPLPFQAIPLQRHDFKKYKPMYALYLDIQKQLVLEDLEEEEVRGRWKSFISKWNHGDLAEGWYDPATLRKAQASAAADNDDERVSSHSRPNPPPRPSPSANNPSLEERENDEEGSDSEDDSIGPTLPGQAALQKPSKGKTPGPSIPNTQDLALRRELEAEDREQSRSDLQHERKADRQLQKTRLDELVPRAEAGSKERMLEKKREKADANRAFASAKGEAVGGVEEVGEADLMGGEDGGGVEGLKKRKMLEERRKNEREVRKEEILRARREEREERVRAYQEREERTMSGLVALARARFG